MPSAASASWRMSKNSSARWISLGSMDGIPAPVSAAGRGTIVQRPRAGLRLGRNGQNRRGHASRRERIRKRDPQARLLLTTFSLPLANALEGKLRILTGEDKSIVPRVTVLPFKGVAHELFTLAFGHHPRAATENQIRGALKTAASEASLISFTPRFLASEWLNVVDAWQLQSLRSLSGRSAPWPQEPPWRQAAGKTLACLCAGEAAYRGARASTWPSIFGKVTAQFVGGGPTNLSPMR